MYFHFTIIKVMPENVEKAANILGRVVTRDVPDYGLVWGNPARLHGFVCPCGARLVEHSQQVDVVIARCLECGRWVNIPGADWEKVGEAQLQKVPYMLVVGDREVAADGISPRRRDGKDLGLMELPRLIDLIREENAVTSTMLRAR